MSDLVNIGGVSVKRVTKKAILIATRGAEHWVPKSLLSAGTLDNCETAAGEYVDPFYVCDWWAEKELGL